MSVCANCSLFWVEPTQGDIAHTQRQVSLKVNAEFVSCRLRESLG